jgi:CheY-like chemotaxis protein
MANRELRILVVDDDATNRRLAMRMLARAGYTQAEEARDGFACLALVRAAPYDVILLDISMPDLDGIETCKLIRETTANALSRIIACTAHAGPDAASAYLAQGFNGVLTKPFRLSQIAAAVSPEEASSDTQPDGA